MLALQSKQNLLMIHPVSDAQNTEVKGNKRGVILFVEDDIVDRMNFERYVNTHQEYPYDYIMADSVQEAGCMLESEEFDAVVMDYSLGDGTAFDLFEKAANVPIIIITGVGDQETAVRAMKAGAYDYLIKDHDNNYLKTLPIIIKNAINRKKTEEALKRAHKELEIRVEERTIDLAKANEKLKRVLGETVRALASALGKRDPFTAVHQLRVAQLSHAIGQEMHLNEGQIEGIRIAGALHDIGKIYIPADILSKPGRLTKIEFGLIKTHCKIGYEILKDIEFDWPIAQAVLQHHERLNGNGYPAGLCDNEIILESKILAVADVMEAMSSHRPYRPALGIDIALKEISLLKGTFYDPDAVDSVLSLFNDKGFEFTKIIH